jgi:4-carboxymuconolactone decarboxylase
MCAVDLLGLNVFPAQGLVIAPDFPGRINWEDTYMSKGLAGARLERVEREDCPDEYLADYDNVLKTRGMDVMPNVFSLLANSPGAMAAVCPVGEYVRYKTSFDDALREYVILTVAQELRCTYEWAHHHVMAQKVDASADLLGKIGTPEIEAVPGEVGLATRYARILTRAEDVSDDMFAELKETFGTEGFVDLTVMIGYYGMLARFINTVKITPEPSLDYPPFNI